MSTGSLQSSPSHAAPARESTHGSDGSGQRSKQFRLVCRRRLTRWVAKGKPQDDAGTKNDQTKIRHSASPRFYSRRGARCGFRPFIFRLASELLSDRMGHNSPQGVTIEVDGGPEQLRSFLLRIESDRPPMSFIQSLESSYLDAAGFSNFEIRKSETNGTRTAMVLPDIATCPDCLDEIFDPTNRRYQYPFTNWHKLRPHCYSIIESLPYDRPNTTMKRFKMCSECRAEYDDPLDRRFHAQPNACPICGPQLSYWDADGKRWRVAGTPCSRRPTPFARGQGRCHKRPRRLSTDG